MFFIGEKDVAVVRDMTLGGGSNESNSGLVRPEGAGIF